MSDAAPSPSRSDLALDRLTHLHPKLIDLSLDRINRLLARMDHPEAKLPPVVHVAGTNGKGSVVAYVSAILEAAGYGVHVYTSPHLVRFHERIRLAAHPRSKEIGEDALADLLEECERLNEGASITFFEVTTAAALLAFSRAPADAVVLETGMGGRYDTTNVVARPAVTVITPIDYDHQEFLGSSLREIAWAKAGILKPQVPAIIGPQPDEALAVIDDCANDIDAPLYVYGQDWSAHEEHGRIVYQDTEGLLDLPLPRLTGRHQIVNAGTAVAAIRHLSGFSVSNEAIEAALLRVTWPARLQRLTRGPLVDRLPDEAELWLDGGHNPSAARAIAQTLADMEEKRPRPLYLICGMLTTKDADGFLSAFRGLVRAVETVPIPGNSSAYAPDILMQIAERHEIPAHVAPSIDAALSHILGQGAAHEAPPRILICGSLYLAGHVLSENS